MACTDVQTIQAGNGTKTQFSFDFPYIFKSEIHVYFWNAVTKEYDEILTTDATYPWQITDANPTIVEFTGTAPPSPATPVDPGESTVDNVKIRRITKIDDIRALFNPGSAIRSDDLNKNFEQLRYAIQEANCAGIPDDVDQYLKDYYWDRYDNTLYDGDTWVSDDTKIATTAALDARFQDEVNDTFTKAELAAASNIMPDDDVAVPTTGALNDYINEVITNDIGTDGTGITVTDDGDGTITLGLADNTIDFSKIKNDDIITYAEQPTVATSDNNIFTASAAERQFDTIVQVATPSGSDWEVGKTWLQNDVDKTLSIWNGSAWVAVASGGSFTELTKVIYVDAVNGDDTLAGHRISNPKKTIKAAIDDINADADGDGSIVLVAPGIYGETFPISIQKNDVAIVGQSLRNCIVHPAIPAADQAGYDVDVPEANELATMFEVNSGTYIYGLTLTGMKASGTRGGNALDTDSTYGLPTNQGWNFAFRSGATIKKSPYIQNCTNFSDSQINNVNFTPHTPGEGAAGDLDSGPSGGGILIDGSTPAANSPLRSMVCDSYTHTALDGPGIFVTNNGYCQATSSYSFFNHFHLKTKNGGQANLAASTTDFGSHSLIADGRSPYAIFTATTTATASDGDITFTIGAPTARTATPLPWHGNATRPQDNMLVDIGGNTYPILSAVANGAGWDVTISRPDPNDRSTNLGLNGAVSSGAAVSFFLRSMIASSGHTMEYVGSGTDYTALPENGGVPDDTKQLTELNNGKIWAAITDHRGTFTVGDTFSVNQQTGFVDIDAAASNSVTKTGVTGNAIIPAGTTAQRGTPSNGHFRYNTTDNKFEGYVNGSWGPVGASNINDLDDGVTNSSGGTIGVGTGALANDDGTNNNNTAFGKNALNANTTGTQNTATGFEALKSNTTGNYSIANGYRALYSNTTGGGNTAIGVQALYYNTTGLQNIAVGYRALFDNTTGNSNTASGYQALENNTTGTYNTATGHSALNSNTIGNFNTANGYRALYYNTTGSQNIANGYLALNANTTGVGNVAVGLQALLSNTTGNSNTANGTSALSLNTTGANNTANGYQALYNNTTGTNNVANGYRALFSNTTGSYNIANGYQALYVNTTGSQNIANGYAALFNNTTGLSNVANGHSALTFNTEGNNNTANGFQALYSVTTGNKNIGIGFGAGDAITTGSNNTIIGDIPGTATLSNTVIIGAGSTERLRIDNNGRIGIGTTVVNATVDIKAASPEIRVTATGANRAAISHSATGLTLSQTGAANILFETNSTERMRINSSGNVGIGNTSPLSILSAGTGSGTNAITINGANSSTSVNQLVFAGGGSGNPSAALEYDAADPGLAFQVGNYSTLGSSEVGRFDSAGRFLVGTSSAPTSTAVFAGRSDSGTAPVVRLDTTNSAPADGEQLSNLYFGSTSDASFNAGARITARRDSGTWTANTSLPTRLELSTTADGAATPTERMRIDSSGHLLVNGTSASGTNKLQVIDSDASIYGITVGRGGGATSTNTAVGTNALNSNTTGANNTANGYQALEDNTTGSQNTANGVAALNSNTTGASNTANGFYALISNTSGSYNVANGENALGSLTSGSGNFGAAFRNSSGSYAPVFNPTTHNNRVVMGHTSVTNAYVQVAWTVVSDQRDKMNFGTVPHGLDFIKQLNPVSFQFKVDRDIEEANGPVRYGFKAQDILALEGDNNAVIIDNEDPDKLRYNGEALVPVLVNAIKEQQTIIDTQQQQINALIARLDAAGI